ncbi:S9 family peptidase [Luteimonas marina]|uniref:S9 family peptidase n=1 Tax=Luteimonas marina TaxID=488485 RepID=A0A5C5TWI1_9GAMM|nr:S9 family peptidase [Luteimonas marina]TWT18561.1 S9 family peptidase [Luteimonas marina]
MRIGAILAACLALCAPSTGFGITPQELDTFIEEGGVRDIKISPTGEYLAMSVRVDGQTGLMVTRRGSTDVLSNMRFWRNTHVQDFWWVNNERLVMSLAETFGTRDDPVSTGELYAVDADGSRKKLLVGYRVSGAQFGSRIGGGREGDLAAYLVDPLHDDEKQVLVTIRSLGKDPYSRVERMNVYDGRRTRVTSAPVANADFVTDSQGRVRFAVGSMSDNQSQLFHRKDDQSEWEPVNRQRESNRIEMPLGFAEDDVTAYLRVSQPSGPDRIVALDTRTGERKDVAGDAVVDPRPVFLDGWKRPIGAWYFGASSRLSFFDEQTDEARLQQTLQRSFPGARAVMQSSSRDGRWRVVVAESDVDPGSFYLFDTRGMHANMIIARDAQIDSERMSPMRPIELKSRDGLTLHGFITTPASAAGKAMPMVVMPHGGPFGIFDAWGFDSDAQLLAAAGYAVLQVNFRGSANYGRAFRLAGARQWGGTMQDDVTDATRWAISEGIADPDRICIYGASYGAYAALMGTVREPDLYRCAIGYVGVYDLPMMQREDSRHTRSGATWSREWVGDDVAALQAVSPNLRAAEIKVPVLLAAGGEDFIAPIEHTKRMEAALKRTGGTVEALYYPKEGHGFYEIAHRREFYTRLLRFLDTHIGSGAR